MVSLLTAASVCFAHENCDERAIPCYEPDLRINMLRIPKPALQASIRVAAFEDRQAIGVPREKSVELVLAWVCSMPDQWETCCQTRCIDVFNRTRMNTKQGP